MSSFGGRVKQMLRGDGSEAAIIALSADLRVLQQQVAALERHLHELEADHELVREHQVEEFDRIRESVGEVTDDLTTRIAAVHAQLRPSDVPS